MPNLIAPKIIGLAKHKKPRSLNEAITGLPCAWSYMTKNTQRQQSKNPSSIRILNIMQRYENKSN